MFAILATLLLVAGAAWLAWGHLPDPRAASLPFRPDAIVVLGGGDGSRGREAYRMHLAHPDAALIVTGDGNEIFDSLVRKGVQPSRIHHETAATSTWENALLTLPILDKEHASKVVIVTDWFHVPRALAVFRKAQPGRIFHASFEPRPAVPGTCEISHARRERAATVFYTLRHGINPMSGCN
jgi:uncharacterized SAM-binding protein YcdF (DUF218 family)